MTAKKSKASAKKPTAKKVAAKKTSAKKAAAKKPATKKAVVKKTAAKKAAPKKKPAPKKVASKKPTAKKAPVKKAASKKVAAKKAVTKKVATKKASAKKVATKKVATKKAATKKVAAKKAPAKKKAAKKAPAKKKAAKKAPAKKKAAKKAPAKKKAAKKRSAKKHVPKIHYGGAVLVSSKRAAKGAGDAAVLKHKAADAGEEFHLVKKGTKKRTKSYSKKDLVRFRKALLDTRLQLIEQVNYLRNISLKREDIGFSEEDGTDAFQRQVALNLAGREGDSVSAIDDAVHRIDEGTYGVCVDCTCLIEKARLEALPFASLCIGCKSTREKQNGGRR
jgi:RNA polymerase-binding transcription factor DksA